MSRIQFIKTAKKIVGKKNVFTDKLRILAYGTDASFYRYLPKAVIKAKDTQEVQKLIKLAGNYNVPITFRAAGTSLSGQTLSNSIIILIAGKDWNKTKIENNGTVITMQPGVLGKDANTILRPFSRKIGPDPASINSAMIGGIVANNASGMTSGVLYNSYNTLENIKLVLPNGSELDTLNPTAIDHFRTENKELLATLTSIRERILSRPEWHTKIAEKYKIKNTTGYGLNSLIDFEDPIEILKHLVIGSEGTLAFISEVSLRTVKTKKHRSGGLLFFSNLHNACQAAVKLNQIKVDAIELIDRNALKAIENNPGIPDFIQQLSLEVTCLLIEFSDNTEQGLSDFAQKIKEILAGYQLAVPISFSTSPKELAEIWNVRKGIFPSVGANRKPGTTVIIEDVAFRLDVLSEAITSLRNLLDKYNYSDAVIYGHANDGNVHFIFSENFENTANIENYKRFMIEIADMVVNQYNGSLKAEHGTGRNIAPFVAYEWGEELYGIMKEIKNAFDPKGIFNPGVLLNEDSEIHIKNFKPIPVVNEKIDKCIECGFCEINCLTNELTISSRHRIIGYREIVQLRKLGLYKESNALKKEYKKLAANSCATDGLCSLSCPVKIDTGLLTKDFRHFLLSKRPLWLPRLLAHRLSLLTTIMRISLRFIDIIAKIFGYKSMEGISKITNWLSGGKLPKWNKFYPKGNKVKNIRQSDYKSDKVVFFPSCINRTMGPATASSEKESQTDITLKLLERASIQAIYPDNLNNLCCGTPWESKGYFEIANMKSAELEKELLRITNNGEIPVLVDTSPCLYRMRRVMDNRLKLFEPVEYAMEFLVPRLNIKKMETKIALHPTCTSIKMGLQEKLLELGQLCATEAVIPENVGCCGFAGDKGFFTPEINSWALRNLKPAINDCSEGYSNSRTCEIGLSTNSEKEYKSIFYLLEKVSR